MKPLTPEHLSAIKRRILGLVGDEALPEPLEVTARRLERNRRARDLSAERRRDVLIQGLKQACEELRDPRASSVVYFVRCSNFVKIGFTEDLRQRLRGMSTDNPFGVDLVGCIRGPLALERAVHVVFKNHSHRGEWFRYNSLVQRAIRLQGRHDMETAFIEAVRFNVGEGTFV